MNIREKAAGIYRALPMAHRVMVVASVLVVAMAAYLFMGWVNRPEWSTVYRASDATDLTEALEMLNGAGVANQVDGNTIEVPTASVTAARSALAGTTSGGGAGGCDGWELLDGGSMTISNAVQDVNIQRALECELERDLVTLDFVRSATVNLALPDEALWAEDQSPPTAAVMITPTRPLGTNEVQTVAAVIASSVEGLDPADVTVTDGQSVHAGPGQAGTSTGQDNLAFTRAVENEGARKVQDMLEGLLGEGMVDVSMAATLNFDQSTVSERTVDPNTVVALARQTVEETYTGEGTPPGGVVGVDGGADVTTGAAGSEYSRVEDVAEFAVSEVYREATEAPGRIERMSISVLMDDGTASGLATPPSEAQIEALVSAALGLDPARGDAISVVALPFPEEGLATPEPLAVEAEAAASPLDMIPKVIGGLVLVVVAVALLLMTRKPKSAKRRESDVEAETGVLELGSGFDGPPPLESGPRSRALPTGAQESAERARDELIDLVERQPEEIAVLLRSWLSDRRVEA